MLTTIAGIILFVAATVVTGATRCPPPCTCDGPDNALSIECQNLPEKDPDKLLMDIEQGLAMIANESSLNVTSLTISNTALRQIPPTVCRLTSLTTLNLNNNRLTSLPDNCVNKLKALTTLSAAQNDVTFLQDGVFDGLNRLNSVNFWHNRISRIGLHVFSNVSDLLALRHISLAGNLLTSLEPWPIIRGLLGTPESRVYIDLCGNLISNFTDEINFHFDCSMYTMLDLDVSDNRMEHVTDMTRGWNLYPVDRLLCLNRVVNRTKSFNVDITSWYMICDCVDFSFISVHFIFYRFGLLAESFCQSPNRVKMSTIPLDQFICNIIDKCPDRCHCIEQPSNATIHVDCSRAGLTSLPYQLPALPKSYFKYKLVLTGNTELQRIKYHSYFINTTILDLRDCGIKDIDDDGWKGLADINEVFLDGNQLTSLPQTTVMDKKLTSKAISFARNPWSCSCDNKWMSRWLNSIKDQLNSPGDVLCASPTRLRGTNILQIATDKAFCTDPVTEAIIVSTSSLASFVVLIICLILISYRLRVQMHSRWKFHPFDRDECQGEDMLYDVFLCCSSEDHQEYGLDILRVLESKNYRVCYHLRDFDAGEMIEENIVRSVQTSKRTICLMTTAFLDSNHCMREFNVALHHNVTVKRSRRLIVLMMLENPSLLCRDDVNDDMVALRQYLRQYTYIDYNASDWTQKLIYALPVHGMNELDDADVPLLTG